MKDSAKALDTIRRARRHIKRPAVVQASNGMEEALVRMKVWYPPGVPCRHPGCLAHQSHPCEGCGRVGGRYPGEVLDFSDR